MDSHEIDYEIFGNDMQIVEIELDPYETVVAEAGMMNYMEDGIRYEAKMGDGSQASAPPVNDGANSPESAGHGPSVVPRSWPALTQSASACFPHTSILPFSLYTAFP